MDRGDGTGALDLGSGTETPVEDSPGDVDRGGGTEALLQPRWRFTTNLLPDCYIRRCARTPGWPLIRIM